MGFNFYGRYIYTDGDEKEVERNMYAAISCFRVLMIVMDMRNGKIILKNFLVISSLISEQKCHYAQMRLVGKTY